MNLLRKLTQESPVFQIGLEHVLYLYMLTQVTEEDGLLWYNQEYKGLLDAFPQFTDSVISDAIIKLMDEGLLVEKVYDKKEYWYQIGTITEGVPMLFNSGGSGSTINQIIDEILEDSNRALEDTSNGITIALIKQEQSWLEEIQDNAKWTGAGLSHFWACCSQVYLMEKPRTFMAKEYGQFKILLKLYEPVTCLAMIRLYLSKSEVYCPKGPSIGHCLVLKDRLYTDLNKKGKVTTKEHLRVAKERKF